MSEQSPTTQKPATLNASRQSTRTRTAAGSIQSRPAPDGVTAGIVPVAAGAEATTPESQSTAATPNKTFVPARKTRARTPRPRKGNTKNVRFSSAKENWSTPPDLFAALHSEFSFTLDVCAEPWNCKLPKFFTKADDALKQEWTGTCWMNPPYGKKIADFVRKAWESSLSGATVVCLVPARTDTRWWEWCTRASEIRWIKGRVKFVKEDGIAAPAPFPSAIVVFRPPTYLHGAEDRKPTIHRRMFKLGKKCHCAGRWIVFPSATVGKDWFHPRQMRLSFV